MRTLGYLSQHAILVGAAGELVCAIADAPMSIRTVFGALILVGICGGVIYAWLGD